MLGAFLEYWNENFPDVITGWNVQLFDIPILLGALIDLVRDILRCLVLELFYREILLKDLNNCLRFPGISTLDYLELYRKFTYTNQESYRLDHICSVELGEKIRPPEYDTFKEFYENDWQKFIDYNIHDVRLVDKLDNKMKLLDLAFTMAYDAKVNYEDVFSQVHVG